MQMRCLVMETRDRAEEAYCKAREAHTTAHNSRLLAEQLQENAVTALQAASNNLQAAQEAVFAMNHVLEAEGEGGAMPQQREPDGRWEVPLLGRPPFVGDDLDPASAFLPNGTYRYAGKGTQCSWIEGKPVYYHTAAQGKAVKEFCEVRWQQRRENAGKGVGAYPPLSEGDEGAEELN